MGYLPTYLRQIGRWALRYLLTSPGLRESRGQENKEQGSKEYGSKA
jgi:hypothetical protein